MQTLSSLKFLHKNLLRQTAIVFAGKVDAAVHEQFYTALKITAQKLPELMIHVEDRFLSDNELDQAVHLSHAILAPYQKFPGSSGLLISAAAAEKPIITQDYGLVGELTRQYSLGMAIDTTNPAEIADAIGRMLQKKDSATMNTKDGMQRFLAGRTPDAFAGTIYNNIRSILN
jgi:glycosyltransferase involved in cell wall biosynthesis